MKIIKIVSNYFNIKQKSNKKSNMTSFQFKLIKIVCTNFKIKPESNEKLKVLIKLNFNWNK